MSHAASTQPADVHGGNVYVGPPLGRSLLKVLVAVAAGRPQELDDELPHAA